VKAPGSYLAAPFFDGSTPLGCVAQAAHPDRRQHKYDNPAAIWAFNTRRGQHRSQRNRDSGAGSREPPDPTSFQGSFRSTIHAAACRTLGIRHLRTRAYRPQTNGKAERFIRTLLTGWAYGAIYRSSTERTAALGGWLWHYNHYRKHSALGHQAPIARLNERNQP